MADDDASSVVEQVRSLHPSPIPDGQAFGDRPQVPISEGTGHHCRKCWALRRKMGRIRQGMRCMISPLIDIEITCYECIMETMLFTPSMIARYVK